MGKIIRVGVGLLLKTVHPGCVRVMFLMSTAQGVRVRVSKL